MKQITKDVDAISIAVTNLVMKAMDAATENDQMIIRNYISDLAKYEIQVSDLTVRVSTTQVQTTQSLHKILAALKQAINRLERILMSVMNSDNNT